jgi:hypothetical protein
MNFSDGTRGNDMATVIIEPIDTKSAAGWEVKITGIDPSNSDCIIGTINTPGKGPLRGNWNLYGLLRGGNTDCNLDMRTNEMIDLVALARKLGAES